MSSPFNPQPPGDVQPPAELPAALAPSPSHAAPAAKSGEDPPWTFWDVVLLAVLFVIAINVILAVAVAFVGATHLFGYDVAQLMRDSKVKERLFNDPRIIVPVQCLGYLVLVIMMAVIVHIRQNGSRGLFESVGWRWPVRFWPGFVIAGVTLAIVGQLASNWLPIPPSLPFDKFFQTPTYAYVMSAFGIFIAPVAEELFFRGFLYPVLARALGIGAGVLITSLGFTLLHGAQLGFSWAAMLIIFIVGFVLTMVRARTRSVAACVLLHMSYNATLFLFFFIASDGFKHLERT